MVSAAKLRDFHCHDLRHDFASQLVMRGVSIFTVKELMRHASAKTTERYSHLSEKHLRDAVAQLDPVEKVIQPTDTARDARRELIQ